MSERVAKAIEHYNRSSRARRIDDFETAVHELDACLCLEPPPDLQMLAWFNLGEIIFLNFGFMNKDGKALSDDEYAWSLRSATAVEQALEVYERAAREIDRLPGVQSCRNVLERAEALRKFFAMYGHYVMRDGNMVYRAANAFSRARLLSLRCFEGTNSQ